MGSELTFLAKAKMVVKLSENQNVVSRPGLIVTSLVAISNDF